MPTLLSFNLKEFSVKERIDSSELVSWLRSKGFNYPFDKTLRLKPLKYEQLITCAKMFIPISSSQGSNRESKRLENEIRSLEREKKATEVFIQEEEKGIEIISSTFSKLKEINISTDYLTEDLQKIRLKYVKAKAESNLKYDSHYQDKLKEKRRLEVMKTILLKPQQIEASINEKYNTIRELERKLETIKEKIKVLCNRQMILENEKKIKAVKLPTNTRRIVSPYVRTDIKKLGSKVVKATPIAQPVVQPSVYTIDWQQIQYLDGYIVIKIGNRNLNPYQVKESRKSFNNIKAIYKFRNAPPLIINVAGNTVKSIENEEVLFYYLEFFTFSGSFDKSLVHQTIFSVSRFHRFSKHFYQKNLPNIFLPQCFSYLCERVINDLPIIPIPEIVIHSNGSSLMHDSFLFPVKSGSAVTWVWESVEESKASYIFNIRKENMEDRLQRIYDYLTGDTTNKRQTLINNRRLAKNLGLYKRILHTDVQTWKVEVQYLCKG